MKEKIFIIGGVAIIACSSYFLGINSAFNFAGDKIPKILEDKVFPKMSDKSIEEFELALKSAF